MAGAYKRKTDKARGKDGKYTIWWYGADGKRNYLAGSADRRRSLEIAQHHEAEARRVKAGLVDPGEKLRREAGMKPVSAHVEDYRRGLLAKGDTPTHAARVSTAILRVLADASIASVSDMAPDRLQEALGRLKAVRSARTCNHALAGVKAFATWLKENNRIKEVPRGLASIKPYSEASDRRVVRRALTLDELARLIAAAEVGITLVASRPGRGRTPDAWITGPERAMLYLVAMGTGFRANELRSLTPEMFELDSDHPTVTVKACYSKNGKEAAQPIARDLADRLRPWIAWRNPGLPVFNVPEKTAKMLRVDLEAAGIKAVDASGRVLDFHGLRHSYITHLAAKGTPPKVLQTLARHSTITLTLDRYCHVEDGDIRGALEGKGDE